MRLKNSLFIILAFLTFQIQSQSEKKLELSEGFAAFVVKDIDRSIKWYTTKLGFDIVNKTNLEERGIKQVNLKLGNSKIELIESRTSIDPTDNITKKVLIQGIFKVGFIISNFDAWKTHLIQHQIITERDVVTNPTDKKRMLVFKDPDGNRLQLFEN